jgi:hypothetical protein
MNDIAALFPFYKPPEDIELVQLASNAKETGLDFSRVIFLDIDGVLHAENARDEDEFCFVRNFSDALHLADQLHRLPIVISSKWRHFTTLEKLRSHFPLNVQDQIIGVTPYLRQEALALIDDWDAIGGEESKKRHRQREILQWINAHAPGAKWLAIDDRPEYFHTECEHLFLVPKAMGGITGSVAAELVLRMNEFLKH